MEEIRICESHQQYQVPLISTFSFPGAEFWCPYCGYTGGMFGAGRRVPITDELQDKLLKYRKHSEDYLHAIGIRVCVGTTWKGKIIHPNELPPEEKERLNEIIKNWQYEIPLS